MQTSLNYEPAMSGDRVKRLVQEQLYWFVCATAVGLFTLAVLMLCRRAANAIHEPLPVAGLVLAGFFLGGVASIAHFAGRISSAKKNAALISEIALSIALFAVAATLTLPGTSLAGLGFFWVILLAEEGFAWRTRFFRVRKVLDGLARFREGEAPAEPKVMPVSYPESTARQEPRPPKPAPLKTLERDFGSVETMPEEVTQQLTRSTAADGTEELAGWLRAPFAAGQRTQSVHLAFCPPFAHTPELEVEQIDGPETRIKAAQVLPFGARLDLKLHTVEESPTTVVLHFSARGENKANV